MNREQVFFIFLHLWIDVNRETFNFMVMGEIDLCFYRDFLEDFFISILPERELL